MLPESLSKALAIHELLYSEYQLHVLRKLILKKFEGKSFTLKEFQLWAKKSWIYEKYPELIKFKKRIASAKTLGKGLVANLFVINALRDQAKKTDAKRYTLEDKIPFFSDDFKARWQIFAEYKYYSVKKSNDPKLTAKRAYQNAVGEICEEVYGFDFD